MFSHRCVFCGLATGNSTDSASTNFAEEGILPAMLSQVNESSSEAIGLRAHLLPRGLEANVGHVRSQSKDLILLTRESRLLVQVGWSVLAGGEGVSRSGCSELAAAGDMAPQYILSRADRLSTRAVLPSVGIDGAAVRNDFACVCTVACYVRCGRCEACLLAVGRMNRPRDQPPDRPTAIDRPTVRPHDRPNSPTDRPADGRTLDRQSDRPTD